MNINKKELRKISHAFRSTASRAINAHYKDFLSALKLFLKQIDSTPLIKDYIKSFPDTDLNIEQEFAKLDSKVFTLGNSMQEEIVNIYSILKKIAEDNIPAENIVFSYLWGSSNIQDGIKAFGQRVVLVFVNHIEHYLTDIGIDMGIDESEQYNITVNGGQVNLAKDNSSIHAVQNNGISSDAMQRFVEAILATVKNTSVPEAQIQQLSETLSAIQEEMKKPEPKKSVIKLLLSGLQNSATVLGVIPLLDQKVKDFATFLAPYLV